MVGIGDGLSSGRKVFCTSEDVLTPLPAVEDAGMVDDLLVAMTPAAPTEGVSGLGVMVDVQDRSEIEVDSEKAEKLSGGPTGLGNKSGIPVDTKFLGGRKGGAEAGGAPDPAPLVVDGNKWRDLTKVPQIVGQFPALVGVDEITREENEPTGLNLTVKRGLLGSEFRSAYAKNEELIW